MVWIWHYLVRPALRRFSPETAHRLVLFGLRVVGSTAWGRVWLRAASGGAKHSSASSFQVSNTSPNPRPASIQLGSLAFPNALGLAAGCDKNALAVKAFFALGFGSVEVGTFTPQPQTGNPRPRVFRLAEHAGIINRMGLPNVGMEAGYARLAALRSQAIPLEGVLGVNIGCNNDTLPDVARNDFASCAKRLLPVADYLTVNLSCPNVHHAKGLQDMKVVRDVLNAVADARAQQAVEVPRQKKPLLLKLSPDILDSPPGEEKIEAYIEAALEAGFDGLIGFNTSTSRENLTANHITKQPGGLSGTPLQNLALERFKVLAGINQQRLALIGCGGIDGLASAQAFLQAGAHAVQLYTALVYQGPALMGTLLRGLQASTAPVQPASPTNQPSSKKAALA